MQGILNTHNMLYRNTFIKVEVLMTSTRVRNLKYNIIQNPVASAITFYPKIPNSKYFPIKSVKSGSRIHNLCYQFYAAYLGSTSEYLYIKNHSFILYSQLNICYSRLLRRTNECLESGKYGLGRREGMLPCIYY